jgi:hypothetical protein
MCVNKFNLPLSTVLTLWKNKEKILFAFERNPTKNKLRRKCGFDNTDKALVEWFKVHINAGFPIKSATLKTQIEKSAVH